MGHNIENMLDNIEADLVRKLEKLKKLRDNQSYIEYREDSWHGFVWRPLTDDIASIDDYNWKIDELRVGTWYNLVKTDDGIRILNKEEYETFLGDTIVLYQGSYKACKDFIKV